MDGFNSASRYLDGILNINNIYFDNLASKIYKSELALNKANTSDTEASFLDCNCPFLMILFLPNLTIDVTILILKFKMVMFLALWGLYFSTPLIC